MAKQQQRIDPAKTYVAVESFVGELEPPKGDRPAREFAAMRGITQLKGDHEAVRKFSAYFTPVGTPSDDRAWVRGWDHVIANDVEADRRLRHEREAKYPPQLSADESYEVVTAFATGGRAFNVGDRIRRDDPVVAGHETYLEIPARPLVG